MISKGISLWLLLFVHIVYTHDKWIVVTTIQYPTEQLKKLAAIPGWRLVVVGDQKTPHDWHLNNCDYLSPEKQITLGYSITTLLPWNNYARKNIGYLYAIEHGASLIYETDDDNEPLYDLQPLLGVQNLPLLTSQEPCVNVYHYFGQRDIWPRGYPLEKINSSSNYSVIVTETEKEIGIEQGLVNSDPDVDAIYRLTHVDATFFPAQKNCILDMNIYCPFNSQNTFIHKKAFFSLYLPSSVSMRVADIWRSFYAQKLLHLDNLYIAFSGPNALQIRNSHNLMDDFALEQDLYFKSLQFINFLRQWRPLDTSYQSASIMHALMNDIVQQGFLKQEELLICQAWLNDLRAIGYFE